MEIKKKNYNCFESKTDSHQSFQMCQELNLLNAEDECAVDWRDFMDSALQHLGHFETHPFCSTEGK